MICKECGNEFTPNPLGRKNTGFCCKKCADRYRVKNSPKRYKKVCAACGMPFETNSKEQRFCSRDCGHSERRGRTTYHTVCRYCGNEFDALYPDARFCSTSCGCKFNGEAKKAGPNCTCAYCGREFYNDHPATRKYCSKECSSLAMRKGRTTELPAPQKTCSFCGTHFIPRNGNELYCSDKCRSEAINRAKREKWAKEYKSHSLTCEWCGKEITVELGEMKRKYCSKECARASAKHRYRVARRMKESSAFVESVNPTEVYEESEGVCALCGLPVHNNWNCNDLWGATLDHIVPVSKGGKHERENIQLAHRICNSIKSDQENMEIFWFDLLELQQDRWRPVFDRLYASAG